MKKRKLSQVISFPQRVLINSFALISTVFLTFYNQLVCPFLESRPFYEELITLTVIFLLMSGFREIFYWIFSLDLDKPNVTSSVLKLYLLSWIIGGALAMGAHELLYHNYDPQAVHFHIPWPSDYPWHSHLKVLSGYWFLGAGLIVQLELIVAEGKIRDYLIANRSPAPRFSEYISNRITWANFFYTFVPSTAMLIMVLRYALQDMLIPLAISAEIAYIGSFFVTVALISARVYGKRLRNDTALITDVLSRIQEGDFSARLWPARQDELGLISSRVNDMAEGLLQREKLKESFGHFVSPEIAERIMEEYDSGEDLRTHGEKKHVAVLMCDIRNFSGLSETMLPSDIAEMLNRYFDHMVGAIRREGGVVDKFIGDAVMAVFGLISEEQDPCYSAVRAALEMRKELKLFNEEQKKEGKHILNNGIGIHYGEVVASFLGSSERLEYTVIGPTVNMAARLESQARSPQPPIIYSHAVAEKIKTRSESVYLGEENLKGVGPQKLYSLPKKSHH
ncbi:MAG: adenylate/guanylate cyclase domain-containing protein [Spirochaetales bacterium]|nr:adenylate/guanylate cyclase domain-containing protein [Spirochaetales bacterium]